MTDVPSDTAASRANVTLRPETSELPSDDRRTVLREIGVRWYKFSDYDLSALTDRDDLVSQLMTKYRLDEVQARRDVDALLKGRRI